MTSGKVIWFARRFGVRELFGKALRQTFMPRRQLQTFNFNGETYRYFDHPYNWTWLNERCVEIPIALRAIQGIHPGRVLEVGNVLSHYVDVQHRVIDKYEGPEKLDVVELTERNRYDRIISVSTFEHIGFDEPEIDPTKIHRAVEACLRALRPTGFLLFTVPTGYNKDADYIAEELPAQYLLRVDRSEWHQIANRRRYFSYGWPYPYANQLTVVQKCV